MRGMPKTKMTDKITYRCVGKVPKGDLGLISQECKRIVVGASPNGNARRDGTSSRKHDVEYPGRVDEKGK